jgi:nitrite reductase/ring-hydroxylating ferredoxin subunit
MDIVPCDDALPDVLANVVKHLKLFKQVQPRPTVRDRILMVPVDMSDGDYDFDEDQAAHMTELQEAAPSVLNSEHMSVMNVESKKAVQAMVCNLRDLRPGVGYPAAVQGRRLAVFLHGDGRIFAVNSECPHAGGALEDGAVKNCEVACPLHDYKFDLASGRCSTDPSLVLKTYPVFVEDSKVWVEIHV